jgi:hypothetical protein
MEVVKGKSVCVEIDGKRIYVPVEPFEAPLPAGSKSFATPPTTTCNGTGTDREILRHVINISSLEKNLSTMTQIAIAKEGIVRRKDNDENAESSRKVENMLEPWEMCRIKLEALTPGEVKRRTGFRDLKHLLCYAAVVYGGNLDEMAKTATKMTWLEELVLYFDFTWHRSKPRWQDYEQDYACTEKVLRKAIKHRARKELECRERWPMYASYEEDARLRDPSWNRHFDRENGNRVVMHDTTNIPLPDPSSGDLNRALYNSYYSMCCAKAGVAVQLCCWIFGLPLVTGHSDDDRQIEDTKILELQKKFFENDSTSDRQFLNVFDKGYHQQLETNKYGQMCFAARHCGCEIRGRQGSSHWMHRRHTIR